MNAFILKDSELSLIRHALQHTWDAWMNRNDIDDVSDGRGGISPLAAWSDEQVVQLINRLDQTTKDECNLG